jgi:hypothetical protein
VSFVDHKDRQRREGGLGRPVLLAIALGFACVGLALPAHTMVAAIVPVLISVVALLAAFRVIG